MSLEHGWDTMFPILWKRYVKAVGRMREQRKWMEAHGGSIVGYKARMPEDVTRAEEIYQADFKVYADYKRECDVLFGKMLMKEVAAQRRIERASARVED